MLVKAISAVMYGAVLISLILIDYVLGHGFVNILVLSLTTAFLNKYLQPPSMDRIDDLLHESKEALRQANEILEKIRIRQEVPTGYSYLDEEPQEIKPLRIEVPILHMAIIDTLGTTRSQSERDDAGDAVNITDSTLLSVTSLLDLESISEPPAAEDEVPEDPRETKEMRETRHVEFRNRTLWDVLEEDANFLEYQL